jgi:hypothetical protein
MGKGKEFSEESRLTKSENMSLEEVQLAEQLYNSAGLDPVVEAGLKDYGKRLQQEDKVITKVLGPRGSDIKGYGEAVAKRVAFAIYALLNKQYGGKVGDLRSYIMTLEEERDRANARYDELMGRVVGILGEEYRELRTDSKAFMEKLTTMLGEDIKESRIDSKALAEKLADIDGLREEIIILRKEKVELKERHEFQLMALRKEHSEELQNFRSQIEGLDAKIEDLTSEKEALADDLIQLREDYNRLKAAAITLEDSIPCEEIGREIAQEQFTFLIKDSKVPRTLIKGAEKLIDFRKYLGLAAAKGAEESARRSGEKLYDALSE